MPGLVKAAITLVFNEGLSENHGKVAGSGEQISYYTDDGKPSVAGF